MELLLIKSLWGVPGPVEEAVGAIEGTMYGGVEDDLPSDPKDIDVLASAARSAGLRLIPLISLSGESPDEQVESFRYLMDRALGTEPDRVVAHSGRDVWGLPEAIAFYEKIVAVEEELGVSAAHETHRSRPLATPWATAAVLGSVPELRLCCDFSHWTVVCERLLEDQQAAIELAARHAIHLHARVGSDQTSQVEDPADPLVEKELSTFESWWDLVWDAQERGGFEVSTLTPEYGPPPYQRQRSGEDPLALSRKLAAACDWQAALERSRFGERRRVGGEGS